MKMQEIRELTTKELRQMIEDEKKHLRELKLKHAISPLENPYQMRDLKRKIARLLTELRQRELAENPQLRKPKKRKRKNLKK
jgi:large subunit ribosomal protein L29